MAARRERRVSAPAITVEGREQRIISMAMDLAEKQIREGTATSQVITHYLKMGSSREQLEQQRLEHENLLLQVKAEQLASAKKVEELYGKALSAMRTYSGQGNDEDEDDYYEA